MTMRNIASIHGATRRKRRREKQKNRPTRLTPPANLENGESGDRLMAALVVVPMTTVAWVVDKPANITWVGLTAQVALAGRPAQVNAMLPLIAALAVSVSVASLADRSLR